ncbi:unnamed protein product, partial [Symbiodinium microadriaticum]
VASGHIWRARQRCRKTKVKRIQRQRPRRGSADSPLLGRSPRRPRSARPRRPPRRHPRSKRSIRQQLDIRRQRCRHLRLRRTPCVIPRRNRRRPMQQNPWTRQKAF